MKYKIDINKSLRKIKNESAFTIAEALVAILILLMVTSIVVAGIPSAKRAYDKVVAVANAETLLSTTVSTLRNELGLADMVSVSGGHDDTSITYYNEGTQSYYELYCADNRIIRQFAAVKLDIVDDTADTADGNSDGLLPSAVIGDDMQVEYSSVSYDKQNRVVTFHGLEVKSSDGTVLAPKLGSGESFDIAIRVISS